MSALPALPKTGPLGLIQYTGADMHRYARQAQRTAEDAASEMLAVLQWMIPEPGQFRQPTDELYARALAVIAKAALVDGVSVLDAETVPPKTPMGEGKQE